MTEFVIRVLGFANGVPCPFAGQYLKSFDFDADNGGGFGEFTNDIDEAKKFDGFIECAAFWKTQSTVRPFRADGEPNRPFTASTVAIERIKENRNGKERTESRR